MKALESVSAAMLAVVILGALTTLSGASAKVEGDTIVIGAVLAISGKYRTEGLHTYDGYEFAVERINETAPVNVGGKEYKLRIQYYDDGSSATQAAELSQRLIVEDEVRFMLGPYSSILTKAVARVTERYKVPLVAAEAAEKNIFDENNKYTFGLFSSCDEYLAGIISLASEILDKPFEDLTLAVAVENDRFSLCVRAKVIDEASNKNVKVVIDEKPDIFNNMLETLTPVKEKSPDILVISGHAKGAETAVRQIGEMGLHKSIPIIAVTHCEAAGLAEKFPDIAEGIFCPSQWAASLHYEDAIFGTAGEFAEDIKQGNPDQSYDEVPYQMASAAAAVAVWKDSFERANSFDPEKLRTALAATDLNSFYGRIKFGPHGQICSKPMILRQIRKGKLVAVERPQFEPESEPPCD
jgi:branched-chain amino acid transport system substrate-binding protein